MGPLRTNDTPTNSPGSAMSSEDFGPAMMAGPGPEESDMPGSSPDAQSNALQSTIQQVMGMEQGLTALSQQFPAANNEITRAVEAVRAVLQRIVSTPSQSEPPSPNSLA